MIHFNYVFCPHITGLEVDGGFKYTLKYNNYSAQVLMISNSLGYVSYNINQFSSCLKIL